MSREWREKQWCLGPESNQRHADYLLTQMVASGELERVNHHYTPANIANKLTNGP